MENSVKLDDSLKKDVEFVEEFSDQVRQGHIEAKECRDYVNNIQVSEEDRKIIEGRGQPVIIDNQIASKTDYFMGIERQTRTDPKAFPRTPQHEEDADAITDGLRYACDNGEWDIERSEAFDNLIVEGIEGYSVVVEKNPKGEYEIFPRRIAWDRLIYDYRSTDRYFRDSKRKGVVIWMDEDDAKTRFKNKHDLIEQSINAGDDEDDLFEDKPTDFSWNDKAGRRLKVVDLYELKGGVWLHKIFSKEGYFVEPAPSKYLDEFGRPDCPIELGSAYIDKDNDRFGLVRRMISLQDMVNKMLSKYMHYMNSNQTWGNERGPDATQAKKQANLPNGHFSLKGDAKYGEAFGIVSQDNKAVGTFTILQQAMQSLSQIGGSSIVDEADSGRAKELAAQNKLMELGPVLDTHRQVSKRVYKQIYNRMKQFWTEPKWVRITDDENVPKFTQLNERVTYRQALMEKFDEIPQEVANHPGLNDEFVRNNVSEIDVDIILEESQDVITVQQETFQVLANLAEKYGKEEVPFEEMVRLSNMPNKNAFLERTKGNEQQRQKQAETQAQKQQEIEELQKKSIILDMEGKEIRNEEVDSKISLNEAKTAEITENAEAQGIENELVTESVIANTV